MWLGREFWSTFLKFISFSWLGDKCKYGGNISEHPYYPKYWTAYFISCARTVFFFPMHYYTQPLIFSLLLIKKLWLGVKYQVFAHTLRQFFWTQRQCCGSNNWSWLRNAKSYYCLSHKFPKISASAERAAHREAHGTGVLTCAKYTILVFSETPPMHKCLKNKQHDL